MKKGKQNPAWDFGRTTSAKPRHPKTHISRGAPSSRHYRKSHVETCLEVANFAKIKRARRKVYGVGS